MATPKFKIPFTVATRGAGSTKQAPHRSTMQRFLIMTNVTMLFLISLLMIFMITLQLVRTLARIISAITPHWKGLEKIKTAPLVLTGPGNQQH